MYQCFVQDGIAVIEFELKEPFVGVVVLPCFVQAGCDGERGEYREDEYVLVDGAEDITKGGKDAFYHSKDSVSETGGHRKDVHLLIVIVFVLHFNVNILV